MENTFKIGDFVTDQAGRGLTGIVTAIDSGLNLIEIKSFDEEIWVDPGNCHMATDEEKEWFASKRFKLLKTLLKDASYKIKSLMSSVPFKDKSEDFHDGFLFALSTIDNYILRSMFISPE